MISMKTFWESLMYAVRGILHVAKQENSFRIQLFAAFVIIITVIFLPLEIWQRILLLIMTAGVLVLEILNTVLERLSDILKPRLHPIVKEVKDMMAGAVLITSFTAFVVAFLIFLSFFDIL